MNYLYPFDVEELNKVWAREKVSELVEQINEGVVVKRCVYTGGGETLTTYGANEKAPSVIAEGLEEGRVVIVVTPVVEVVCRSR
jgi:hypothetical protein